MRANRQRDGAQTGEGEVERRLRRALGRRIAALREQRGWGQDELGRQVGVTGDAVGNYERGIHAPRPLTLVRLRHVFSVSVDYLLAGAVAGEVADPRLRKLALAADALPPDHRTLVVTAFAGLVEAAQKDAERVLGPGAAPGIVP